MREKQQEYCLYEQAKIVILSWNIDSRKPIDLDIDSEDRTFLSNFLKQHPSADFYVFGFQELVNLESVSFFIIIDQLI